MSLWQPGGLLNTFAYSCYGVQTHVEALTASSAVQAHADGGWTRGLRCPAAAAALGIWAAAVLIFGCRCAWGSAGVDGGRAKSSQGRKQQEATAA